MRSPNVSPAGETVLLGIMARMEGAIQQDLVESKNPEVGMAS